jgi:hypothetical protein
MRRVPAMQGEAAIGQRKRVFDQGARETQAPILARDRAGGGHIVDAAWRDIVKTDLLQGLQSSTMDFLDLGRDQNISARPSIPRRTGRRVSSSGAARLARRAARLPERREVIWFIQRILWLGSVQGVENSPQGWPPPCRAPARRANGPDDQNVVAARRHGRALLLE